LRVVAAPDKFRGTASAAEVAAAVAQSVVDAGGFAVEVPMADGGEGTLEALGGPNRTTRVTGPLGRPVEASWRLDGSTAVIEMALTSGLLLAGGSDGNRALDATTAGTGELIRLAVEQGARRVLVGMGGSATTDGGLGALRAMGSPARYRGVDLLVACDVRTSFVEAAEVDGVGVVDRATVEQGTQPRFPAHEAHRVTPDGLQSVRVEHCRRRVEVGDQPQPRLEVDADDRVGRLLALDQFDGAVAGHESPTASRGAHAETAQRFDVGPGEGAVPGRDPLREVDGVESPERLDVG